MTVSELIKLLEEIEDKEGTVLVWDGEEWTTPYYVGTPTDNKNTGVYLA